MMFNQADSGVRERRVAEAAEPVVAQDAQTQEIYTFPLPVTVGRGRSLSIPIVHTDVPAARTALLQPRTDANYPLATINLTNSSAAGLPAGAVTVYEAGAAGGSFVGDALLSALPAGDSRYLSFALDQKLAVTTEREQTVSRPRVSLGKGFVKLESVERLIDNYAVKSVHTDTRELIVELPKLADWKLLTPPGKLLGEARGQHRVALSVPPQGSQRYAFVQERPVVQTLALSRVNESQIKQWLLDADMDVATRTPLGQLEALFAAVKQANERLDAANAALQRITQEQSRLRDNLAAAPANSSLQRRYLAALDASETEVARVAVERADAEDALVKAKAAIDRFVKTSG